jgi:hypothetical protein
VTIQMRILRERQVMKDDAHISATASTNASDGAVLCMHTTRASDRAARKEPQTIVTSSLLGTYAYPRRRYTLRCRISSSAWANGSCSQPQ